MPTITFSKEPDGSFSEATRKAIVEELHRLTEEYSIEQSPSEHRNHLGVSIIGEQCSRKLWYAFRWVKLEQHDPRMRRLFKRGHSEEEKFRRLLLWIGFNVREIDPATNKQYRFSKLNGHYGGSGDSLAVMPWFDDRILIEYKTHNNKSFELLKRQGVQLAKPLHFAQMSCYGYEFKTQYGLYCAINKDNDELYFEFLELDFQYAQQLENKAQDIITSTVPPPRIADNPSFFSCKYCHFTGICHSNDSVEINCRSCKMSVPIADAGWYCNRHSGVIPSNFISKGCGDHVSINS